MCRRGFTQKLLSTRLSEAWNGKKDRAGSSFNFYGMPFLSMWAFLFKRFFSKDFVLDFILIKKRKISLILIFFIRLYLTFFYCSRLFLSLLKRRGWKEKPLFLYSSLSLSLRRVRLFLLRVSISFWVLTNSIFFYRRRGREKYFLLAFFIRSLVLTIFLYRRKRPLLKKI